MERHPINPDPNWKPSAHITRAAHMADHLADITDTDPAEWYWCTRWLSDEDWRLIREAWRAKEILKDTVKKKGIPQTKEAFNRMMDKIRAVTDMLEVWNV
ncbi:MAG: hypothetical protein D6732_24305 [Methanobacteriota archaeon]|nr:MAG: hypothetical protein D6732_24305 [Euryarchaeota archaeon]